MKKTNGNFVGTCQLKELAKGTIFKFVKKDGTLSSTTYIINEFDYYDRATNKYSYSKFYDVDNGGFKKGDTLVSTDFDF